MWNFTWGLSCFIYVTILNGVVEWMILFSLLSGLYRSVLGCRIRCGNRWSFCQQGEVMFDGEPEWGRPCPLRLSETGETPLELWGERTPSFLSVQIWIVNFLLLLVSGRSEWQRTLLPDFSPSSWSIDSRLAAELCSRWQSHKDQLSCRSGFLLHALMCITIRPYAPWTSFTF